MSEASAEERLYYEASDEPEIVLQVHTAAWYAIEYGDCGAMLKLQESVDRDALDAYMRALALSGLEPATPVDIVAYGLSKTPGEVTATVDFFLQLRRASHRQQAFAEAQANGWRADEQQLSEARQWERSGLELAHADFFTYQLEKSYTTLGVNPRAVTASLQDGRIAEIFQDYPDTVALLQSYSRDRLGGDASGFQVVDQSGERDSLDIAAAPGHTPDGLSFTAFFTSALEEAEHKPYKGKHLKGPYYALFVAELERLNDQLRAISPSLTAEHLHAVSYQSAETRDTTPQRGSEESLLLDQLYRRKDTYLAPVGERTYQADRDIVIEPGLLAKPPYIRSIDPRSCVSTCFRMVFADITKDLVNETELTGPLKCIYNSSIVDQEELLKIFETEAFQTAYDKTIRTISFTGMDLRSVRKICESLIRKDPDYRIHLVANIRSRTSFDKNVWHAVVVTAIGEDSVTFHDPASDSSRGRPDDTLSKAEFMQRWASTYNTGFLVIS